MSFAPWKVQMIDQTTHGVPGSMLSGTLSLTEEAIPFSCQATPVQSFWPQLIPVVSLGNCSTDSKQVEVCKEQNALLFFSIIKWLKVSISKDDMLPTAKTNGSGNECFIQVERKSWLHEQVIPKRWSHKEWCSRKTIQKVMTRIKCVNSPADEHQCWKRHHMAGATPESDFQFQGGLKAVVSLSPGTRDLWSLKCLETLIFSISQHPTFCPSLQLQFQTPVVILSSFSCTSSPWWLPFASKQRSLQHSSFAASK